MFAVTCILFGNPTLESTETHSEDPKGKLLPSPLHQALPSQSTNKEWFHPQLTVTTIGASAIFIGLLLIPENVPLHNVPWVLQPIVHRESSSPRNIQKFHPAAQVLIGTFVYFL